MLLHGLRQLLGARLLDAFRMSHMYDDALPDPPAASHLTQQEVCHMSRALGSAARACVSLLCLLA
jgi:hypothetical protein